ncbi:MAG TPA: hypothetical protein VHW06_05130 [Streptosporangiaceae bacterium]|jgi:hypothetical protein|nr:hypothetical protein [Streptosporangiaceae bacterium]
MDPNAHGSGGGRPPGANAYWQRRFFTLVGGLGVIGLLAWAFSGMASGGGKSSHSSGSGGPSSAAYATTAAGTPAPAVSVTTVPATPSPSASPSASSSASPSATKPASAAASSPAKKPAKKPASAASAPTACPASDLVLTLTASAGDYSPSATPSFQLDIVSTDSANCLVDTGPAGLKLVVTHGSAVAYNSASCLQGAKRHVVGLRRGVPVVTSMSWNKHQTTSDCSTTVMAATNRTYSAVAQAGGTQSPGVPFRLTAAPAPASTK